MPTRLRVRVGVISLTATIATSLLAVCASPAGASAPISGSSDNACSANICIYPSVDVAGVMSIQVAAGTFTEQNLTGQVTAGSYSDSDSATAIADGPGWDYRHTFTFTPDAGPFEIDVTIAASDPSTSAFQPVTHHVMWSPPTSVAATGDCGGSTSPTQSSAVDLVVAGVAPGSMIRVAVGGPTAAMSGISAATAQNSSSDGHWAYGVGTSDGSTFTDGQTYYVTVAYLDHGTVLGQYVTQVQFSAGACYSFADPHVPTISGRAVVGRTLTANTGDWSPDTPTFSYRWYANGQPIAGATAKTLVLTRALGGRQISVGGTASQLGYVPMSGTSQQTAPVLRLFTTIPTPTFGRAVAGTTVTAVPGTWQPTATLSYQWHLGGVPISGATQRSFTIPTKYLGKSLSVVVTGERTGYLTARQVSATHTVVAASIASATTSG